MLLARSLGRAFVFIAQLGTSRRFLSHCRVPAVYHPQIPLWEDGSLVSGKGFVGFSLLFFSVEDNPHPHLHSQY